LRLAFLGDSGATGLGAAHGHQTPAALLAEHLAERSGRPVLLSVIASVGARTEHLADQVDRALIIRPNVAVIFIGVNDVSHLVPQQTSVRRLAMAVTRLREGGSEVVVGTCPDLGTLRPIRPPLRNVVRRASRRLAQSQSVAVRAAGGWPVSLGAVLGPEFAARPLEMFSSDQFHPSEAGYAAMVDALRPVVLAAAGYGPAPRPALPGITSHGVSVTVS
jgi:lysophospholipase L1-like esterase